MELTPRTRFNIVRQMVQRVMQDQVTWSGPTVDTLLDQFGLYLAWDGESPYETALSRAFGRATDENLLQAYATVMDIPEEEAGTFAVPVDHGGLWHEGYVRLFLSHSASEKVFAAAVASELAVFGVQGFVAHESMEVEKSWQPQIERALRTAEMFVAFVHPPFNDSDWCQQELGWAEGRGLPIYCVRLGADPRGFASATQWPSGVGKTAQQVAMLIVNWLDRSGALRSPLVDGLLTSLADAHNYFDAEATAKRVAALGQLSDGAWGRLNQVYWENDQVHGGVLPTRVLRPFYLENGRDFPPPRPSTA